MNERELSERGWPCPTGEEMGRIDRDAIELRGLPGRLLMENAGRAVASAVRRSFPDSRRPLVVCGGGNNGGDGFVVARVLHEWDDRILPVVLALGDPERRSPESAINLELLSRSGVEVVTHEAGSGVEERLERCDLVVDAVFGVGLRRSIEGPMVDLLKALDGFEGPRLAVDLPSGISSDSGEPLGVELRSDVIVTLGLPKLGLALRPLAAEIWVADIGLPAASLHEGRVCQWLLSPAAIARGLPRRPVDGHKGTFGHMLVIAGSEGKTGAALLTAQGALRAGAGLVSVAVPRSLNPIFEANLVEAMSIAVEDGGRGHLAEDALETLRRESEARSVVVVGPGVGQRETSLRLLRDLIPPLRTPAVIDADGLNAFEGQPEKLRSAGPRILTPHPGEAARLLGCSAREIQADRVAAARELAKRTQAVVVLKGARTVIAAEDGDLRINATGGPGLAAGGSGDVLAGVIGALLGQGLTPFDAASIGAHLHGLAGDLGPAVGGRAFEVADRLPEAWQAVARGETGSEAAGVLRRFP